MKWQGTSRSCLEENEEEYEPGYTASLICLGSYFSLFSSIFLHKALEVLAFVKNVTP